MRLKRRERVVGSPSRTERVNQTSGAFAACWKSWAIRPIRRSGNGRPALWRRARFSQGSGSGAAGQVPSFRPPRMARSTPPIRASWVPRMRMRVSTISERRTSMAAR